LTQLDDFDTYLRLVQAGEPELEKNAFLVDLARGRDVLDIGCIDHSASTALELGDAWLHKQVKDVAKRLVGLDMLESEAATLRELGYDIRIGDAEGFSLGERFDLVIAGDLIEHLANPGLFLRSVRDHLTPEGQLVITTPNPFNIEQAGLIGRRSGIAVNPEHVLWLDPVTAHRLVRRCGFSVAGFHWLHTRFAFPLSERRRVRGALVRGADFLGRRRAMWRRDFALVLRPAA
jgi:2-polyprenyl-3-methyl-5-hydroxy-6-metoxy-1,4-benzoquinol methylase